MLALQYELHKTLVYILYYFTVQVKNTGLEHGFHDSPAIFGEKCSLPPLKNKAHQKLDLSNN